MGLLTAQHLVSSRVSDQEKIESERIQDWSYNVFYNLIAEVTYITSAMFVDQTDNPAVMWKVPVEAGYDRLFNPCEHW